jgi:GR25 family glycosyltransferase involved in LPS biosynthesis
VTQLAGYYINLDRATDRNAFMQEQLTRLGMQWVQRHPAVDGGKIELPAGCTLLPGELGCMLSHLEVLRRAPPDAYTLVLEDDPELSPQLPELLGKAVQGGLGHADLLILECQTHFTLEHVSRLWDCASRHIGRDAQGRRAVKGVDLISAREFYKWGCSAYVVSPAGRARFVALCEAWLRDGPVLAIDRALELALVRNEMSGLITMPFLATTGLQWHGKSTVANGWRVPPDFLMVLRRLLYAGDLGEAEAMAQSFAAEPADPALRLFGLVLREVAAAQRNEIVAALLKADRQS